jgi:hypothetical protein
MDTLEVKEPIRDIMLVQLAREIAIDHLNTDQILKLYSINIEEWEVITSNKRFQTLLEQEIIAWQTATNTAERTKLKAGAIIEAWLPESNMRLHDSQETLPAKVELAKMIARIAGLGMDRAVTGENTEKFSLVINIGDGNKRELVVNKTNTIEHNAND